MDTPELPDDEHANEPATPYTDSKATKKRRSAIKSEPTDDVELGSTPQNYQNTPRRSAQVQHTQVKPERVMA